MTASIAGMVRTALSAGWSGTWKELAAALNVDVRRVYHARFYLRTNARAGSRGAQPSKRRRVFDARPSWRHVEVQS